MHRSNCNTKNYVKEYKEILKRMICGMTNAKLTDSISHNFIVQMIPHHQAAIEMSNNILKYTENEKLISIAKNIISEQTKSIEDMQDIQDGCSCHINTCCKINAYQSKVSQIMKTMFSEMGRAYIDNYIDCDFMREMIPHHMGAIKMSKNALQYKICDELKPILDAIISSQEEGVCQMKNLLSELNCKY